MRIINRLHGKLLSPFKVIHEQEANWWIQREERENHWIFIFSINIQLRTDSKSSNHIIRRWERERPWWEIRADKDDRNFFLSLSLCNKFQLNLILNQHELYHVDTKCLIFNWIIITLLQGKIHLYDENDDDDDKRECIRYI